MFPKLGWKQHRSIKPYFVILAITLIIAVILSIALGSTSIPLKTVLWILAAKILPGDWIDLHSVEESHQVIIWVVRTPRTLAAALVGMALAIAGAQMQGLFQNPLASPDIIGTSSGGVLGAVIALVTGLAIRSAFYIPLFAFIGALTALLVVYTLVTWQGKTSMTTLLLAGIALHTSLGAVTSLLISLSWTEYEVAREIIFWLMGGFDSCTWLQVWLSLPGILLGTLIAFFYSRELDLLLMGQDTAYSLGVEVEQVKQFILLGTALLTGAAVAVSGMIGFVGLIIPHMVRFFVGPKHRYLIPAVALSGATFLVLLDMLARTLQQPTEIRLGILTAMVGGPFFLYLLLKHRQANQLL